MNVLGIDPGIRGGLAVVNADGVGTLLDAIDIPVVGLGARERVDVAAIREWIRQFNPALALVERAQAMPRQGASSGFKYGRATGALEATVVLCAVRVEISSRLPGSAVSSYPARTRNALANVRSSSSRPRILCSRASVIMVAPKPRCSPSMGFAILA